ncbi:F-box/FBD/LRR-repeat protein At1g13570-like [Vicia villosa]|uniref:F-box/FBD/LRR-repeat protein At1g13570-like n=1 Tax=Vicia villosa TaxID=3911 RepID=UPI00273B34B4|nr:F-box/FBD/LRR-repeat protein At1g13570-like [Vicia villosa]XP_058724954.1 F-box/FBD/LRR-repeat protein At1g13570-like [Vicia villosa]XP_058724955.1 F-box/FBD/LRR-repeat protein At1g13570-like [Vicia villosa]XP_058724956.1 F-box/FBD/LRR-repeat protein At1g13570-like [Vicia villosa]
MERKETKSIRPTDILVEPDMISGLPGHVIDVILSFLPIIEAVGTSVLSKKWRNCWRTLPNLVFDPQCVCVASHDPVVIESKFLRIVYHVLLHHSGPINMFKIDGFRYISENLMSDIDEWILYLVKRSVKELVLEVCAEEYPYGIPRCLFSCQSLHRLKLKWGYIRCPKTFEGFKHLKSLDLNMVQVEQDDLENLISSCPLLEDLTLSRLEDLQEITIHAPNLKFFKLYGEFESISFDNTYQLTAISIELHMQFEFEGNQSILHGHSSNLLKFLDHQPCIQSLEIHSHFLKYLATGVVPLELPTPCINLRYLSLFINLDDLNQISAVLCLLRSSPNLKTLEIFVEESWFREQNVLSTPDSYNWEDIFSEPVMSLGMQYVTINNISGFKDEIELIRFLLLYSPGLKKMIVKPKLLFSLELKTKLIQFKRASEKVEVIYDGEDYL